jgi:hypothetical protein
MKSFMPASMTTNILSSVSFIYKIFDTNIEVFPIIVLPGSKIIVLSFFAKYEFIRLKYSINLNFSFSSIPIPPPTSIVLIVNQLLSTSLIN